MLSETMRTPTGIFFTTLLGVFALLFGFGIVVVLSGALPDILADLDEAARALSLIAPLALSVTTKQASNSSTDQGGGKRRWEGIEFRSVLSQMRFCNSHCHLRRTLTMIRLVG